MPHPAMATPPFFPMHEVHAGRDIGGRDVTITPDEVRRYEAGTGGPPSSLRLDDRTEVAPALLFHSEVYRSLAWYLPNVIGNLHARQEWELFAPLVIGQAVRTRSTVVERYRKRDRNYIVNEVLVTDDAGRWLQRSRTHQSFLIEDSAGQIVVDREREKRPERRFEIGEGPGEALTPLVRPITIAMCEAFSGPDKNYHTDREMAQALGFPDIVVQGMLSICFVAELMSHTFGYGWHVGGKMDLRLVNVVWVEDVISTCGKLREKVPEGAKQRALVDVWCEKADGTKTLVGTASALV